LQNFDFFILKAMLAKQMKELNFEHGNICIFLEKIENIRLLFYRGAQHSHNNFFFDERANYSIIRTHFIKNKHLIDVIGETNIDSFLKFLDSFLFGFRDYPNIKKYLILRINPTRDFFERMQEEILSLLPLDIFRRDILILDIKYQF